MNKCLNNTTVVFRTAIRALVLLIPAILIIVGEAADRVFHGVEGCLPGIERWQK